MNNNRYRSPGSTERASTRRRFLRHVAGISSLGVLSSTAGCLNAIQSAQIVSAGNPIMEGVSPMTQEEFDAYVTKMQDRYAKSGVWGRAQSEPNHALTFVGAWSTTTHLTEDGKPYNGKEKNLLAAADSVAVLYRIPHKVSEIGRQHYQFWLWIAGRIPTKAKDDGLFSGKPVLNQLDVGIDLTRVSDDMLIYDPVNDISKSPVTVQSSSPNVEGPKATFPLYDGTIGVIPEKTRVGARGQYAARWTGSYDDSQSLNATCEVSWPGKRDFGFTHIAQLSANRSFL